eukprot:m.1291039 g.1291039  ORF g.1291039 m.1291039 type:complete len:112 (+) comp24784_c0_seq39:908-1243(+)
MCVFVSLSLVVAFLHDWCTFVLVSLCGVYSVASLCSVMCSNTSVILLQFACMNLIPYVDDITFPVGKREREKEEESLCGSAPPFVEFPFWYNGSRVVVTAHSAVNVLCLSP